MKITKYEHACVVIEEGGDKLVIDPGVFSKSFTALDRISGVVVTHVHQDHFDPEKIKAILGVNPNAIVFSTAEVSKELGGAITIVDGDTHKTVGKFDLRFFGGQHAMIHSSYPQAQNVGVLVNETLYYPGDSFSKPKTQPRILAVPAQAPWMKNAEAMDFLNELKPQTAFPTHNAFLNEDGQALVDRLYGGVAEAGHIDYRSLKPGESLEI